MKFHWKPLYLALLSISALYLPLFFMNYTVIPNQHPGVTSEPPLGSKINLARPITQHVTADPTGAYTQIQWDVIMKNAVLSGELPLWEPWHGLGHYSYFSQHCSGLFYPHTWLKCVLPYRWWDLILYLNLVLFLWFSFLYFNSLGIKRSIALIASISYLSYGFACLYLPMDTLLRTMPWLFFLLYVFERCIREPDWRWRIPASAFGTYCRVTGGNPSPMIFAGGATTLYFVLRLANPKFRSQAPILALAMIGGIFLSAPEWMSFVEFVSNIRNQLQVNYPRPSPLLQFIVLFLPNAFGAIHSQDILGTLTGHDYWWDLGWFPSTVSFLAIGGLCSFGQRRATAAELFLYFIAILTVMKVVNLYPMNLLDAIPLVSA